MELDKPKLLSLRYNLDDLYRLIDQLELNLETDAEIIAKVLHEAGREAVLANKCVKKDGKPIGQIKFIEWDELSEDAKEGRFIQANYLLDHFILVRK